MTLPTGTVLHHGNYVVDAFSAEDAIGPIYLATHIPSGRWVQLRILGSRHPEAIPLPEMRTGFYHYLLKVQALNHPLFSGHLSGFEDEGVCYQAMDANLGYPVSRFVSPDKPVSPRQSVALVRQVANGLLALKPLGWRGITLTPDQVWQCSDRSTLTFTGFDFPPASPYSEEPQEARLVRGLSYLLYFLLIGKRAEHTQAPLAVDVRHQLPGLPYDLDTALQVSSREDGGQPAMTLNHWVDLLPQQNALPDEETIQSFSQKQAKRAVILSPVHDQTQATSRIRAVTGASGSRSVTAHQGVVPRIAPPDPIQPVTPKLQKLAPPALVLTALVASFGGLGVGLTARLQPSATTPGTPVRLSPEQSFPPLSDWSGDDPINSWDYSPPRRPLPDYGTRAPQPARERPHTVSQPNSPPRDEAAVILEDLSLEDAELGVESLPQEQDSFLENSEPALPGPGPASLLEPTETTPANRSLPVPRGTTPEPPVPIRPPVEPTMPAPPAPLEPATAPAPLTNSPPPPSAAPAPFPNQGGALQGTEARSISDWQLEIDLAIRSKTL